MSSATAKRKIKILVFAFFLSIFVPTKLYASDITVTCADEGPCDTFPIGPLFNESKMLPGDSVVKTISVINNDSDDTCDLNMRTENETQNPAEFPSRLFTVIRKKPLSTLSGTYADIHEAASTKNLQNIFDLSLLYFGSIPPGGSLTEYEWIVTFDQSAGNEFQEAETQFDFELIFSCDFDSGDANNGGDDNGDGGNGADDGDDDDDDDDDVIYGEVAGTTASRFSLPFFGSIAGAAAVDEPTEEPVGGPEEEETIAGISTEEIEGVSTCKDPWWVWLLFVAQFLIHLIINKLVDEKGKKRIFHTLLGIICGLIFYLSFCYKWYVLISLGITLFWFLVDRNKDKLSQNYQKPL